MSFRLVSISVVFLMMVAPAAAEDFTRGHFPILRVGGIAGISGVPIPTDDPDDPQDTYGPIVGVDVHAHIDARAFLLNFEGIFNVLDGDVWWVGRGQIVLGTLLGGRSWANVIKSMSQTQSGNVVTTTTEWYTHKKLPVFYGLHAGASVYGVRESSSPSYAIEQRTREPATVPVLDVGFTLMSPQIELMLAPAFDLASGSKGLRWAYGMAFPIGNKPLFFRFNGDHFFGSDPEDGSGRRLGWTLLLSIGLGTGMGIHK